MITKEEITDAAFDFLNVLARKGVDRFGQSPEYSQQSVWLVETDTDLFQSQRHQRMVFDPPSVYLFFQELLETNFTEEVRLQRLLKESGISDYEIPLGFLLALAMHWVGQSKSFNVVQEALARIINEFADAVVDKAVLANVQDALSGVNLEPVPKLLNLVKGCASLMAEIESRPSPTSLWRGLGDGRGTTRRPMGTD